MRSTSVYLHLLHLLHLLLLHLLLHLLLLDLLDLLLLELLLHCGRNTRYYLIRCLTAADRRHRRLYNRIAIVYRRRGARRGTALRRTLCIALQIGQQVLPNGDLVVMSLQQFLLSRQF